MDSIMSRRTTSQRRSQQRFLLRGAIALMPLVALLLPWGAWSSAPHSVAQEAESPSTSEAEAASASQFVYLAYTVNNNGYTDTCG